jgi:arginine repressor
MEHETAGDPITGLKWTRRTTEKIARELAHLGGIEVSANTVGRILKELGYCLRVNHKKISSGTGPDRTVTRSSSKSVLFENVSSGVDCR